MTTKTTKFSGGI